MITYPVKISFDSHRMDGTEDDYFLRISHSYIQHRTSNLDGTWIHGGDIYDMARSELENIKKAWGWLDKFESNDIFLAGNHDYSIKWLEEIAPGICLDSIIINGYLVEHGHRLFEIIDDFWENRLLASLLYIHRKTNRCWQWVEDRIEAILQTHRDNEKVYQFYLEEKTMKACFGHTHYQGNKADWWTPGALFKTGTIIIFDTEDSGPRFEKIF